MEGLVTMRRVHIEQFSDLIKTLDEACREMRMQTGEKYLNLCADIQNFVSEIFNYASNVFGEESKLLAPLKELYEMLYYASQNQTSLKLVLEAVREIRIETDNMRADHIEAAFLCYKASMADSLESVYFAAKEDESCDAYFIPIPFYDRNPDGSFGSMHLEGEGYYSDKYELTDWREYDVAARRPDVIFIMNPYDGNNYVTSVHPDFYSSRLKDYTDMLVYIEYGLPYWVSRDPWADETQEEFKKNNVFLPAHLYAHYDIRYSRELAESHVPMFAAHPEFARRYNMTPEKVREKFVPLGSPKLDKVLNTCREDYTLPDHWSRKIEGKKVILYNTSLSEFLKSSAQQSEIMGKYLPHESWYFIKLRQTIETFCDHEDVVLWWRPHPLFEETIHSMRQAFWQEYLNIVQDFKDLGTGIFDDTEDLHRAISWSDGMISDESSLLLLYVATGKPFYIPSVSKALQQPMYDDGTDFHAPLDGRLCNMRSAKGANIGDWNCCIWWDNFLEEDVMRNIHFNNYTNRFIDFILHPENYPETEEYKQLQIQMFRDFAVNNDGTAGQKIYEFVKRKVME